MAEPNLRDLVGDIRQALATYPPEALVEMLTYIFKEYVVEQPAPIQSTFPTMRDAQENLSFAELIRSLQLRLDLPELGLFDVQGERVYVKLGGQRVLMEAQASRSEPVVPSPMASPSPPSPSEQPPAPPRAAAPAAPVVKPAAKPAAEAPASVKPQVGTGPGKEEPATTEDAKKFNLLEVD